MWNLCKIFVAVFLLEHPLAGKESNRICRVVGGVTSGRMFNEPVFNEGGLTSRINNPYLAFDKHAVMREREWQQNQAMGKEGGRVCLINLLDVGVEDCPRRNPPPPNNFPSTPGEGAPLIRGGDPPARGMGRRLPGILPLHSAHERLPRRCSVGVKRRLPTIPPLDPSNDGMGVEYEGGKHYFHDHEKQ